MQDLALLYVTCGDEEEARTIARSLVGEGLVACANILGSTTSVYRCEGEVQEDGEVAVLLKTRRDRTEPVTARVKELHSYDLPCVISLPIQGGNPEFLRWVTDEAG